MSHLLLFCIAFLRTSAGIVDRCVRATAAN